MLVETDTSQYPRCNGAATTSIKGRKRGSPLGKDTEYCSVINENHDPATTRNHCPARVTDGKQECLHFELVDVRRT